MNLDVFGFSDLDTVFDFENPLSPSNPLESSGAILPSINRLSSQQLSSNDLLAPDLLPLETRESILRNDTATIGINSFNIRTEGRLTFNGGGDLDGEPLNLRDDTHIYARRGFTFNNTPILPVQRDNAGNPIRDANGKQVLIQDAVDVSAGFTANANNNSYSNLIPPTVIPVENVIVPGYNDVRMQELAARIPVGTPTVTFNPQQNPINNAAQWNAVFPPGGTTTVPTMVRIASGGLNIPANVQLRNYVIIVENGSINFNGGNQQLNNVALIANNGSINLSGSQTNTNISLLASSSININGSSRFTGKTLLANGSGGITFSGSTNADAATDALRVISQGNITFNGAANLRGELLSAGAFTGSGRFDLFGTVGAKQDITFNGTTTITNTTTTTTTLAIAASLVNDTAPNNTTNTDKITSDPSVRGTVTGSSITEFRAGFDSAAVASYVNILPNLTNGVFTLSRTEIDRIAGGTLSNGQHTLNLLAKDQSGTQTIVTFAFTLDKLAPTLTLDLAPASDSPPVGDRRTTNSSVTLIGQTEANTSVLLTPSNLTTTSGSTGAFQFTNVVLANGANSLSVSATDIAGNVGTFGQTFTRDSGNTIGQPLDLTVRPGGYLEVPLSGVDASGNRVTYRLQSTGKLPTGKLDGNGNLLFTPSVAEIGTYQFNLIASNGTLDTPQTVTLRVVADPVTTTRISGVIANTAKQPLAGVVVEIGNLQATTAVDGSFSIAANGVLPSDTLKVRGNGLTGAVSYPFIAEKLPLLLDHNVYSGANNVIGRPIYLPPLDTANARTIDPNVDTTVTTTAIPNASVFVKAGTLKDQAGNSFTGKLGITEVPREVTPAALPKNLIPDLVVTIQPGDMVFLQPAPLSLPNKAGYAAGAVMDLWSINPTTGNFDNVGKGRVSADGSMIATIEGGIRNSSWHFFAPQPLAPVPPGQNPNNPDDQCDECREKKPINSEVDMHSGAVIETHDLISYQSLGETRGLSLNYNSMRADPRPIVHTAFSGGTTNFNQKLVAKVSVSRDGFTYQVPGVKTNEFGLAGGENIWTIPVGINSTFDVALQSDLRELSSGRYEYTMTSGFLNFTNNTFAGSTIDQKGEILLVNSSKSAFGSGWGLSGLQELVRNDDGSVLLIDGDGTDMLFRAPIIGTNYVSPPGDFSTLERLSDGTFRRTLTDKTVYQFDVNNRLISTKDRHNNETRYAYNPQGQLTQMTDPVGLATTLTYTNNRVTSISDPAGRVTRMEYNTTGDLTKITDPDGTSRTWEYDKEHHMTAEVDKRGGREEDTYNFAGRVVSAKRTDGTIVQVNTLESQGLLEPTQTLNPNLAPTAATFQFGLSTYTDSKGNRTNYTLDARGQVVISNDAVGSLPKVERTVSTNLVTKTTDARGYTTSYTYDAKGNVLSTTGGDQSQKRYTYDPTFNQVTSETDELGRQSLYDIDPITGDVRAITQVVGAIGGDDDLITRYTYTPQGLVDIVTDPLGRITDYDYDALGREAKVTVAKGTTDEAIQQFVYDAAGNPIATINENGIRTEQTYDLLNRELKTTFAVATPAQASQQIEYDANGNQIAAVDENGKRTVYEYDSMGQLVKTTTPDPDDAGPLTASVTTSEYDATGNQIATVDALGRRTQYRYDARNRLVETTHPDGSRETLGYDLSNNNTTSSDARGLTTSRLYDLRGRLIRTTDPGGGSTQFEYDSNNQQIAQIDANGRRTAYTYDDLGRQVSTTNALNNTTTTQYDKIGNVIAQTDELNRRTLFSYDNRDRQIAITTPLGAVQRTSYDKVGNVIGTTDALNRTTRYAFDQRDRQIEITDPLNQKVTTTYDAIGNVTSSTDELGRTTRYVYDGVNRQIEIIDPLNGSTKTAYDANDNVISVTNPLGKVTRYGYDNRDRRTTVTDALGAVTTTFYDTTGNILAINDPTSVVQPQTTKLVGQGSTYSTISSDGRFIAFLSDQSDIFVRNLQTNTTTLVNIDSNGNRVSARLSRISISSDGRFVAFAGEDGSGVGNIFVRDLQAGTLTRASVEISGSQPNSYSENPSISANGRFVAFASRASNLVPDDTNAPNARSSVFVRDLQTGTTVLVNRDSNGNQANFDSIEANISSDGSFVTFNSSATNLVAGDTNNIDDIFIRDLQTGTTKLVSLDSNGNQANSSSGSSSISSDGRFVTFYSLANNLVAGDTNNKEDIFVRDLQTNTTTLVSVDSNGNQANSGSSTPSISGDGRFVTFYSFASNLVANDTNNTSDVFVRDLQTNTTVRISVDIGGNQANGFSAGSAISDDGRFVTFISSASNLVPGDTNNTLDVFVVGPISSFQLPSATFSYDRNDRLISETNASGKTRSYTYDPVGNRTGMTDRNGKTRRFNYDALDRLTSEEWISGGTPIRTTTSSYDAVGQLTSITDPDASYSYTYDLDGRLLSVNNAGTAVSPSVLMTYDYDAAGNVVSVADNINSVAKGTTGYSYDAKDRLTSIQQSGTGVANKRVDYTYNAVGQPLTTKRYSDLAGTQLVADSNLTYDALSRPTNMIHSKGGVNTAFYNYTYDANSRITNVSNKDGTSAYTYDDVDQLTGATYSFQPSESYTYDLNGNRTNAGYQTGLNNRLLSDGTFNYEYDNEGNRTKRVDIVTGAVTEYTWDYRNRLIQATEKTSSGTVVNQSNETYDPTDLRIGKTANGVTERYVYGQNQNITLEFDGSGTQTHRYLHGSSIDEILADENNSSTEWTLTDQQNSVRDLVDSSGAVSKHLSYDAFGKVISQTNPSVTTQFGYTGRDFDPDTGLNYNRARYYDSFNGKFISQDPIGFDAGDVNLYRYVKNQPVNQSDPSGQAGEIISFTSGSNYVEASIKWTSKAKSGAPKEPASGILRNQRLIPYGVSLQQSPEQKGHLIPEILGGSEFNKMANPKDNFISQNPVVNTGAYRVFGQRVSERLGDYYEAYKQECKDRDEFRNSNRIPICNCPYPFPNPDEPTLNYRVELKMPLPNTKYLESKFLQRPEEFTVIGTFNLNSPYAFSNTYKVLPGIAIVRAKFSNYIDFEGSNPYKFNKRSNYYKFFSNDAGIRTSSKIGVARPVPVDQSGF